MCKTVIEQLSVESMQVNSQKKTAETNSNSNQNQLQQQNLGKKNFLRFRTNDLSEMAYFRQWQSIKWAKNFVS